MGRWLKRPDSLRFNLPELGGALGDLGTLVPLMLGLIMVNGLNATTVLAGAGLFYIASALYFRIPMPVQPLKVVAAVAISMGLSGGVISTSGLIMGAILLLFSLTNVITVVARLFPRPVIKGIQLSIGLVLVRKGIELALSNDLFIGGSHSPGLDRFSFGIPLAAASMAVFILSRFLLPQMIRFPPSLALLTFGLAAGLAFGPVIGPTVPNPTLPTLQVPSWSDFWLAFTVLVIPQLPLTLGNAVVSTSDTSQVYFGIRAQRVTPKTLAASMGIANIAAGLFGAMPMCHGSGGLTAHYKMGARTGGAGLMIGGMLLLLGMVFGTNALSILSLIPLSVLGVLLAIVGVYHASLARGLSGKRQYSTAVAVAAVAVISGNLALGFGVGIVLHQLLRFLVKTPVPTVVDVTKP
ncbi:MAG: sulfate permease [Chloroflexi bacterium]|nr:sulfate permease [Chloroflexota bacterium]